MSEAIEARRDGARLQPNSGRGTFAKGDAIMANWLIDYKEYPTGMPFDEIMWGKVCTDAANVSVELEPAIKLVLGGGMRKTRIGICDWATYEFFNKDSEHETLYVRRSVKIDKYDGVKKYVFESGIAVAVLLWEDLVEQVPI